MIFLAQPSVIPLNYPMCSCLSPDILLAENGEIIFPPVCFLVKQINCVATIVIGIRYMKYIITIRK